MVNALRKAVGALRLPYVRIGGNVAFPPPFLAHLQTDGSFKARQARVAYILLSADGRRTYRDVTDVDATSSTEAEWASVLTGLQFAANDARQTAFGIENDCLTVIHGLLHPEAPLRVAAHRELRREILELANQTTWTGVRWIPREANKADALFH
jgi:ribonuclease HI